MGPDVYWVTIFALGGIAMGLATSLIGLTKPREFTSWMAFYAFMVTVVTVMALETPFWTVLTGSVTAGVCASAVQITLLPWYRRHNPWYAEELGRPRPRVAGALLGFALFAGLLFGIVAGTIAWALSLL